MKICSKIFKWKQRGLSFLSKQKKGVSSTFGLKKHFEPAFGKVQFSTNNLCGLPPCQLSMKNTNLSFFSQLFLSSPFVSTLFSHRPVPDVVRCWSGLTGSTRWAESKSVSATGKLFKRVLNGGWHLLPEDVGEESRDDDGQEVDEGGNLANSLVRCRSLQNDIPHFLYSITYRVTNLSFGNTSHLLQ